MNAPPNADRESPDAASPAARAHRGPMAAVLAGAIAMGFSLFRVVAYDELYWLTIARRIPYGQLPYFDSLDTKGPLLYPLVLLIDALPGAYSMWRAFLVGFLTVGMAFFGARLARDLGTRPDVAIVAGPLAAFLVALLSTFALTTEILGVSLTVTAFATVRRRPVVGAMALVAAAGIDPRALLFFPAIAWYAHRAERASFKTVALTMGVSFTIALATILAVPELRFSLVGLSTATRFLDSYFPLQQLRFVAMVALPIIVGLVGFGVASNSFRMWQAMAVGGAAVIGAVSLFPFGHYWAYAPLTLIVVPLRGRRRSTPLLIGLLALLAAAPLGQAIRAEIAVDERQFASQEAAVAALPSRLSEGEQVVVWSGLPHLASAVPDRLLGKAPTINYLGWGTARQADLVAEFERDLAVADVIVVETETDETKVRASYIPAVNALRAALAGFPCSEDVGGVAIRRPPGAC